MARVVIYPAEELTQTVGPDLIIATSFSQSNLKPTRGELTTPRGITTTRVETSTTHEEDRKYTTARKTVGQCVEYIGPRGSRASP